MKETFKAITFDRKQRIAFWVICLLILIGSLYNMYGVTYADRKVESVDLEAAIHEPRNYKKYWRKQRKKYYSGSNPSSYQSKGKSYHKKYNNDKQNYNQYNDSARVINATVNKYQNAYAKNNTVDTTAVNVPVDYTLDQDDTITIPTDEYELHTFDPNTVSKEELLTMFLPEKWASNLINYRNKGGVFKEKFDVKKLYATTDDLYTAIESYITINQEVASEKSKEAYENNNEEWLAELKESGKHLDINNVNAETLRKLPGISTGVANGIIKYGKLLGGYHSADQLSEVYYMTPEGLESLATYTVVEPVVNYININEAEIDVLGKHPYITYKRAKVIQKYLKNHGPFAKAEDVKKVGVWSAEEFEKLLPYLTI